MIPPKRCSTYISSAWFLTTRVETDENFLIHASTKSIEWAYQAFPDLKGKSIASTEGVSDILDNAFMTSIGAGQRKSEEALVLEFWIKPGQVTRFPQGAMVTVIGEHVVHFRLAESVYTSGVVGIRRVWRIG